MQGKRPGLYGRMPEKLRNIFIGINTKFITRMGVQVVATDSLPINEAQLYRFLHLHDLVDLVKPIPGSFVECGVASGTSLAMLAFLSHVSGVPREIWGFDSFEGLPWPSDKDTSMAWRGQFKRGSAEHRVLQSLKAVGFSDDMIKRNIHIVRGWFDVTLPRYSGPQIALLHADADLYDSTLCLLRNLYPKVAVGGVVAFDEYHKAEWAGERLAVDEYFCEDSEGVRLYRDRFGKRCYAVKLR